MFTKTKSHKVYIKERQMDQNLPVVREKTSIQELVVCSWERGYEYSSVLRTVITENIINYEWYDIELMEEAASHLEGMLRAKHHHLHKQFELRKEEFMMSLGIDRGHKAIRKLNESGFDAKEFCFLPDIKNGESHIVKGKKNDYVLVDIEKSDKTIPVQALRGLDILERNGLVPYDMRIGYALLPEKTSGQIAREVVNRQATIGAAVLALPAFYAYRILTDPVLAISFSPHGFFVEIFRWDD